MSEPIKRRGMSGKDVITVGIFSAIILAYDDNFDDDVGLIDGLLDVFTFFDQKLDTLKKAVEAAHANARCTERRAA